MTLVATFSSADWIITRACASYVIPHFAGKCRKRAGGVFLSFGEKRHLVDVVVSKGWINLRGNGISA